MSNFTKVITSVMVLLNVLMVARGLQYDATMITSTGFAMLAILFINWVTEGDSKLWSSLTLWSYGLTGACTFLSLAF